MDFVSLYGCVCVLMYVCLCLTLDDRNEVTANPLLLDPVGSGRNSSNDATSVLHRNFLL